MKRRQSIKQLWFITYFFILFTAVTIMSLVYVSINSAIREEFIATNELSLKATRERVDEKLTLLELLVMQMDGNFAITRIRTNPGPFRSLNGYYNYEAYKAVRNSVLGNGFIKACFIYYYNSNAVISDSTVTDAALYYELYVSSEIDAGAWRDAISTYTRGSYISLPGANGVADVYYVRTTPLVGDRHMESSANIALSLNIPALMGEASVSRGALMLLDGDGSALFVSQEFPFPNGDGRLDILPDSKNEVSVIEYTDQNGEGWVLSYITSARNDWRYVIATPRSMFYEKLTYVQTAMVAGIFLCLVLGVILTFISVKVNYNPVKRLMAELEARHGVAFKSQTSNEFAFLHDTFLGMEKSISEENMSKQWVRESCFTAIRKIFFEYEEADAKTKSRELLDFYGLGTRFSSFVVVVFLLADEPSKTSGHSYWRSEEPSGVSFQDYAFLALNRLLYDRVIQDGKTDVLSLNLNIARVYVVFSEDEQNEAIENINETLTGICEEADELYYVLLAFAASGVRHGPDELRAAYDEAFGRLISEQGLTPPGSLPSFSEQDELEIAAAVQDCDRKAVVELMRLMMHKNTGYIPSAGFNLFIIRVYALACTLLEKIAPGDDSAFETLNHRVRDGLQANDMSRTANEITDAFLDIIDVIERKQTRKSREEETRMISDVCAYVAEHYKNQSLSVTSVAEAFGIRAVTLSKLFRESMCEDLPGYINKVRIEHAKALIESGGYSNLNELALLVGFSNSKTLIRAFKRYTGTTPGQYKKRG